MNDATGRTVTTSPFAGDDGAAAPQLLAALGAWRGDPDDEAARRAVHEVLLSARLLVPVMAVAVDDAAEESHPHACRGDNRPHAPGGSPHHHARHPSQMTAPSAAEATVGSMAGEKQTDMRLVALSGADGTVALPAFSGVAALTSWDPAARPVPAPAIAVAQAALTEGADAVVLDPAAATPPFVLRGPALRALAVGRVPLPPAEDPDVLGVLRDAVAARPSLRLLRLVPDQDGGVVVVLAPGDGTTVADAADAARALGDDLAGDVLLRDRLSRPVGLALLPS